MRWKRGVGTGLRRVAALGLLAVAIGCGGGVDVPVDAAVAPFVGDWTASDFTVTSSDNPAVWFRVTDGGSFTMNIQPSGQYTAILSFPQLPTPAVELGKLTVLGASIRLSPTGGTPATSSYRFEGPDRLILDGPTSFDFNEDGTMDPAEARIALDRTN